MASKHLIKLGHSAIACFKSSSKQVEAALLRLLPLLDKNPVGVEGLRIYLLLNELLRATQTQNPQQSTKLAEVVAAAVTRLSGKNLQVIGTVPK